MKTSKKFLVRMGAIIYVNIFGVLLFLIGCLHVMPELKYYFGGFIWRNLYYIIGIILILLVVGLIVCFFINRRTEAAAARARAI